MAVIGMKRADLSIKQVQRRKRQGAVLQNGGVVPPSLLQESRVPRFYQEAIAGCGATHHSQLPNTALVYNLMVASRLPRHVLGNIWSLVNRTLPGKLTRQEFYSCLALIALTQKGEPLSALSTMSTLPIPHLQACAPFTQFLSNGKGEQQTVSDQSTSSNWSSASGTSGSKPLSALNVLSDIEFLQQIPKPAQTQRSNFSSVSAACVDQSNSQPTTNYSANSLFSSSKKSSEQISSGAVLQPIKCSYSTCPEQTFASSRKASEDKERTIIWSRCIDEVSNVFDEAHSLLHKTENHIILELANAERGYKYFTALNEIYGLAMRIKSKGADVALSKKEKLDKIDRVWFQIHSVVGSVIDRSSVSTASPDVDQVAMCSICLSSITKQSLLEFAGASFHKQCANFWINRVDSLLPKVSLM